ncbi:hypothetical protein [Cupriavidus gilardii]|jgi:hypothetical protein|uniref:hypothetical protein n=1 Tax=Cupriavidus gilardii TaxID=82541 RepID=UPI0015802ADF|nr:hypothetical protein [Cupriavidus gilardii]MCT9074838.1 hypothetical protein [Cupriavidus gilardii]QKS64726.1 hypothetical protein FOB47_23600 [Cupriavidus gilardii]
MTTSSTDVPGGKQANAYTKDAASQGERQFYDVKPLPKDVALERWAHFKDACIDDRFGDQERRIVGLIRGGATKSQLIQFWRETKHLSWPGSYGQSPWETASAVGAALDAALTGKPLSAYHRGIICVLERTISALAHGHGRVVAAPQGMKM